MVNADGKVAATVSPREICLRRLTGSESTRPGRWRRLDHLRRRAMQFRSVHRDIPLCVAAVRGHWYWRTCTLQAKRR
jgi:hypothetical protein